VRLADTFRLAWDEPELRQRILFIFAIFGIYAIGLQVSVPIRGFDAATIEELVKNSPLLQMLGLFGGRGIYRLSIFSLGLNPYITASIIMQLMKVAIPALKREDQEGGQYARQRQAQRTKLLTIVLCVFQSIGFMSLLRAGLAEITLWDKVMIVLFWTAGAQFVLWLGEQIQEKAIGQGVSLMIFAGIVVGLPFQTQVLADEVRNGVVQLWQVGLLLLIFVAVTALIVYFTQAQRRITIQHMRRHTGTGVLGGQTSYLPIPVNAAGVIPIIFAVALIFLPQQFASFGQPGSGWHDFWVEVGAFLSPSPGAFWYHWVTGTIAYGALIFFFTYFWTAIQYNVEDIARNLKQSGAYIPGVRQGKQTERFLDEVITRVTVVGALFLAFVALVPYWIPQITRIQSVQMVGGTSLLIIVSVVLDLMRQIEANLLMRGYGK
jgi:preprotein translocase subunit SecY